MVFNSFEFIFFFLIVTLVYFLLQYRHRWKWLLFASVIFYMAFIPIYIFVLFLTIIIDYVAGIQIEKSKGKRRKTFLIISIISTCLVLFIFKYYLFVVSNLYLLTGILHLNISIPTLKLILPIGLSFHTFQSLSYVIEVYRRNQKAEQNFGIYSLYVMFYPQLVAGPIERPQNLLHQFYERHDFEYRQVSDGLKWMLWGMFKKVVIADRLADIVNKIYAEPHLYPLAYVFATICFAFQIYCDFSGYSDIAIGAAYVMGFKLMRNFQLPYYSSSVGEFWRRWHISLSTWFRDYLYIPLGGNRTTKLKRNINLMITFLVSGLWHGANWTYVFWGGLNGSYLIAENIIKKNVSVKISNSFIRFVFRFIGICITFTLICFAWLFFRSRNLKQAVSILKIIRHPHAASLREQWQQVMYYLPADHLYGIYILSFILFLFIDYVLFNYSFAETIYKLPKWTRWSIYVIIAWWIILFGAFSNPPKFIYFQF
jgi:alginate O-acetyltransferase complex protein AlgI